MKAIVDSVFECQNINHSHRFICRDEAWLEVMVAVPAKVILNLSNTDGKILVEKGEALQVGCDI